MATETVLVLALERGFEEADRAHNCGQVPQAIFEDLLAPADLARVVACYPDVARLLPDRGNPYR